MVCGIGQMKNKVLSRNRLSKNDVFALDRGVVARLNEMIYV